MTWSTLSEAPGGASSLGSRGAHCGGGHTVPSHPGAQGPRVGGSRLADRVVLPPVQAHASAGNHVSGSPEKAPPSLGCFAGRRVALPEPSQRAWHRAKAGWPRVRTKEGTARIVIAVSVRDGQ